MGHGSWRNKMQNRFGLTMVIFLLAATAAFPTDPLQQGKKVLAPQTKTSAVSATMKQFSQSVRPPKHASKEALPAEVFISYPEFSSSAAENAAVKAINNAIRQRLLSTDEGESPATFEQLAGSFFQGYEKSFKENPDELGGWSLKFKAVVRFSDEELLSLEIVRSMFSGGAHSSADIAYLVFSPKTGNSLALSDFVPEKKFPDLNRIGETIFRRTRSLKPNETLEHAGFQFEENRFALNRNFLVGAGGMAFCFNQYEIGPFSMGVTEILIPWSDIRDLLDPKGVGARFLKEKPSTSSLVTPPQSL